MVEYPPPNHHRMPTRDEAPLDATLLKDALVFEWSDRETEIWVKDAVEHEHRRPDKSDFEGKTVARFEPDADNVWRIWFTDGTAFAIQCDNAGDGIPFMELCNVCVEEVEHAG